MVWGLEGIHFSGNMGDELKTQAVVIETSGWSSDIISSVIDAASPFYDFYLPREASEISTDTDFNSKVQNNLYAGRRFTEAIIDCDIDGTGSTHSPISSIARQLNSNPESAIEYCLNKNHRNETGIVEYRSWYLPAIDEIEEIMVSGYSDFSVFQDKMYWSCQPAFHKNHLLYSSTFLSNKDYMGDYYNENTSNARATSAKYIGVVDGKDKYTYIGSGVINNGYYQSLEISISNQDSSNGTHTIPNDGRDIQYWDGTWDGTWDGPWYSPYRVYTTIHLNQVEYDEGSDSRTSQINRIRCVRNSGSVSDL